MNNVTILICLSVMRVACFSVSILLHQNISRMSSSSSPKIQSHLIIITGEFWPILSQNHTQNSLHTTNTVLILLPINGPSTHHQHFLDVQQIFPGCCISIMNMKWFPFAFQNIPIPVGSCDLFENTYQQCTIAISIFFWVLS